MLPAEAIQWPTLLDMTKEECQRVLRRFELTAYSGVVSAFRGQGELTKEKRRLLAELAGALGVPADRHRAEVRRAANDEALNTIAHRLAGAGTRTDWAVEGRRVVPVLPRGRPITAYTAVADASRARAERLAGRLPPPGDTRSYEPVVEELSSPDTLPSKMPAALLSPPPPAPPPPAPAPAVPSGPPPAAAAATPHLRPPSPTPGVIRLPSGMSIQLEDELQGRGRKRRRSSSSSDTGPRIHPAPAARTQVSHPQEAYTVRVPPPPPYTSAPGGVGRPRLPVPGAAPPPPPPPPPGHPGGGGGGPRPVGVTASRAPPLPTAVTATATVNTSSGHKVIFVSSSSGAPSPVVACPPRTTVLSEPGPLPGPPPGPPPGPGPGPGVIQSPGVIQGPGGAAAAGERRPRPLDPNTDTYRQMAGLDSRGKPMASRTPVRARGRVGRLPTNCPSSQPGKSATRVATGVKIITHTVPLAAAGTKVMTKGGGQPVLVVPSSAAPPPGAAAAAAAAVRPAVAVRTGSGGRVVTVSGGVGRQLVRHSLHGYALPRAVHVGRSPSGGSPTNRAPASVIVLQKSAAGRPPTVVRPPRSRSDSGAAAVFVSAPQTASPAGRLPAPSPAPTPSAAPAPLSAAAAPAAAPVSAQDPQQVNSSSVLSDILHATGIINPKAAPDGVPASPPPSGGIQKAPPPPVAVADSGRPPPSSPGPGRPPPPPPPPEPPAAVAAAPPPPLADADSSNDTGESITLEQAVQLMNHQTSNPGQSRQILRRAGIRLGEATDGVTGTVLQSSGGDRLPSDPSMELVGELDPQTGIFYPVTQNSAGGAVLEGSDLVQDSAGETLEDISAFLQQRHDPVPSAAPEVSK